MHAPHLTSNAPSFHQQTRCRLHPVQPPPLLVISHGSALINPCVLWVRAFAVAARLELQPKRYARRSRTSARWRWSTRSATR